MPRPWLEGDDQVLLSDVYGSLLRERYRGRHDVDLLFEISLDSELACIRYSKMVSYRQPDVVFLQLGINDCAPRLFRKGSRHLFLQPWFRRVSRDCGMRLYKRFRRQITRLRSLRYVGPEAFRRNLHCVINEILSFNDKVHIFAMGIAEVSEELAQRSFGYLESIREYNAILRDVFGDSYIEVNDLVPKSRMFISDGYHFSIEAHKALANRIAEIIEGIDEKGIASS